MDEGLSTLFRVGKLEVETVLRKVCEKVLTEPGKSAVVLRKRAEGLRLLGKIYKSAQ